jgi:hypothetical protein
MNNRVLGNASQILNEITKSWCHRYTKLKHEMTVNQEFLPISTFKK